MDQSLPQHRKLSVGLVALLVATLWGCAGSSPEPPAPPPFSPQQIVVNLGESGDSVTLTTTQAGGHTRGGQAFASGTDVEADNGNTYKLTLEGGRWTATYVGPEPQQLPLGSSGTTVAVTLQEDGSYAIGGEAIADGQIVPSGQAGLDYTLTLGDDGMWMATYAPPPAEIVQLGSTSATVDLVQQEDGSYTADGMQVGNDGRFVVSDGRTFELIRTFGGDLVAIFVETSEALNDHLSLDREQDGSFSFNGMPVANGQEVVADNGASYRLVLADGQWTAEFIPSDNAVILGGSGATVNLSQQEDGTFLLNGEPFASGGTHIAGNGSEYRLTYSDGMWAVEYLAPPPFMLRLGSSGETISIERGEVGTYSANGQFVSDGSTYTASNGSGYLLSKVGDAWTAAYSPPDPVRVQLGESGLSIRIERLEDGSYHSGGIFFESGQVFSAPNGKQYRVLLEDGVWSAQFASPDATVVALGTSGHTVQLTLQEGGGYTRDGDPFASGDIVTTDDGDRYRLTLSGGVWTATNLPPPTTMVWLGTSGQAVTVTENADGSYEVNGQRIESGDTFTTDAGAIYRLTLSDGEWMAEFTGGTIVVPLGNTGGTVSLTLAEDGTYRRNNRTFRSGTVVVYLDLEYRLDLENGEWTSTLVGIAGTPIDPGTGTGGGSTPSIPSIPTNGDLIETSLMTNGAESIGLRDADDTSVGDKGTIFVIKPDSVAPALEYTIDELTSGADVLLEETHADRAMAQLQELMGELQQYQGLYDVEVVNPDDHIRTGLDGKAGLWTRAQEVMEEIFGQGSAPLDASPWNGSTIEASEVADIVAELQAAIDALANVDLFEDTFSDQFEEHDADEFFEARLSRIRFAGTTHTRYGAFAVKSDAKSALDSTASWTIGAFAYSPLERPASSELPDRGEAIYRGATVAVATGPSGGDTPGLFTGEIELVVRFSTELVDGLITNLEDENGDAWTYIPAGSSRPEGVETVRLPTAALGSRGSFGVSGGDATIQFAAGRGPNTTVSGSVFNGQFVDGDDEAFGTYEVGSTASGILRGGFGVDYSSSQSVERPEVDDDGDIARAVVGLALPPNSMLESLTLGGQTVDTSDVYRSRGASDTGERLVDVAREGLDAALDKLEALINAGDSDSTARNALWGEAKTALDKVFAVVPSNFGTFPDDATAEDHLEDAIAALGSESRFADALEPEGVFADFSYSADEISEIFDALAFDFELEFNYTVSDYTRFGAWANITYERASGSPTVTTGSFAYSPLEQVAFDSAGTPYDFRAVYEGEALAVSTDDGTLYEGTFQLEVDWSPGTGGTNTVSAYVENLETVVGGDLLRYDGLEVRLIQFYGWTAPSSGLVGFSGTGSSVSIRYQDSRIADTTLPGAHTLEGKFVGDSGDGPLGVIGAWELVNDEFGMKGAFGAELQP